MVAASEPLYSRGLIRSLNGFHRQLQHASDQYEYAVVLRSLCAFMHKSPVLFNAAGKESPDVDSHGYNRCTVERLHGWSAGSVPLDLVPASATMSCKLRAITSRCVEPLLLQVVAALGDHPDVLHVMERLRSRIELFDRLDLDPGATLSRGDAVVIYQRCINRFLFDNVVDEIREERGFLLDAPLAPIVRVCILDVIEDVVEILAGSICNAAVAATNSARDVGYLAIINRSGRRVEIGPQESGSIWPSRLHLPGVLIFPLIINGVEPAAHPCLYVSTEALRGRVLSLSCSKNGVT
jgi:hypothetical protein